MQLCMEYCGYFWAVTPNNFLDMLDKLQKRVGRAFGRCSFEGIPLLDVHLNWLNWFQFFFFVKDSFIIYSNWFFLTPHLDVIRVSMSTIFFLAQLDSGILCL